MRQALAGMAFMVAYGLYLGPPESAPRRGLGAWQMVVGTDHRCFTSEDTALLRLTTGTWVRTVARLRVVHVNYFDGIVTFGELK